LRLTVFDTSGPAEAGPPPHRHPWEEIYVVLSGQLEVTVDGQP
jgi:quercetin dioxygenase-like cupin family protein